MKFLSVAAAIILINENGIICADEISDSDQASEGPISKQLGISSPYQPWYVVYPPQAYQPSPIIYWNPAPTVPPSSSTNNIWLLFFLLRRILRDDDSSSSSSSGSEDTSPVIDSFGCRITNPFRELFTPSVTATIDSITNPVGRCVILTGSPTTSTGRFQFRMFNTATLYTNIGFFMDQSIISRNTFNTGWGVAITSLTRPFPLVQDVQFTLRIKISSDHYDAYIDDLHYFRYSFIAPATGITYVSAMNGVSVSYFAVF